MTLQADFASQEYFRNPAAAIEKLRTAGSVVEVRFPIIGKVWATTTQALADQVLKDADTFTSGSISSTARRRKASSTISRSRL
jgi:hypothetical protein